ncbi:hypothetical protein B1A67_00580 [Clostridium botulinum D/C]|uniref:hypothetical protein n=1 Tax=Clostridium botulinum TaxID=1491 RepID=UPI0009929004|nr:hypothetical protein [Clostridium botulinum]OOV53059.1 hypothetical protein B1A66_00535 [Clostridium botulinum D/C]OOV58373.1 hypothetical protein B0673_02735 [Clostridium botulinum D/C]OOV59564.1 hypothetical protein B1A67_00580 [Clostridium botulinum D/C]
MEKTIFAILIIPIIALFLLIYHFVKSYHINFHEGYKFVFTFDKNNKIFAIITAIIVFIIVGHVVKYQIYYFHGYKKWMVPSLTILFIYIVFGTILYICKKVFLLINNINVERIGQELFIVIIASVCFDLYVIENINFVQNHTAIIWVSLFSMFVTIFSVLFESIRNPFILSSKNSKSTKYIWYSSTIVILCIINIFYIANCIANCTSSNSFILNGVSTTLKPFETFYYTISTCVMFSCESISPICKTSRIICILSRIVTVLCISIFINVLMNLKESKKNRRHHKRKNYYKENKRN